VARSTGLDVATMPASEDKDGCGGRLVSLEGFELVSDVTLTIAAATHCVLSGAAVVFIMLSFGKTRQCIHLLQKNVAANNDTSLTTQIHLLCV
jgi:hypothetical protein